MATQSKRLTRNADGGVSLHWFCCEYFGCQPHSRRLLIRMSGRVRRGGLMRGLRLASSDSLRLAGKRRWYTSGCALWNCKSNTRNLKGRNKEIFLITLAYYAKF